MEIKLERSLQILDNYEDLESLHGVRYTGSYSGLFVLSGNKTLGSYEIRKRGKSSTIEKKWDFQFIESSGGALGQVEILFVGKSVLSVDPRKSVLVVTKERRGVVSYQVSATGLEELDVDIRFRSSGKRSTKYATLHVGNIFKDPRQNPGLLAKSKSGEVEVYHLDYEQLMEEDSDEFAWSEMEDVAAGVGGAGLEEAPNLGISPGWGEQDFIVSRQNASYVSMFSLDASTRLQKIGTLTIPIRTGTDEEPIFQFFQNSKKNVIAYFKNFGILYNFLEAKSEFQAVNHFYFGDRRVVGKSTSLLIPPTNPLFEDPSICLDGPQLLPLVDTSNEIDSTSSGSKISHWAGAFLKPITIFSSPPSIVYAQNQVLKLSFLEVKAYDDAAADAGNFEEMEELEFYREKSQPALRTKPTTRWSLYDKSLLDQMSLSQFMEESLQQTSGQLSFQLLLVPSIHLGIRYTSDSKSTEKDSFLGRNWELTGRSYIALDTGRAYYEPDKRYYLILNDHIYSIESIGGTSSSNNIQFKVINQEETPIKLSQIIWDRTEDSWTVQDSHHEFSMKFGDSSKNSIEYGFVDRNWETRGSELKLSLKWYLTKHRNMITGKTLNYEYTQELSTTTKPATNIAHLRRVLGPEVEVLFDVGTVPGSKVYKLRGLTVKTKKYQQDLQFTYQELHNVHHLSTISQKFKSAQSDIFRFVVEPNHHLITQIYIPRWSTEIKYSYASPESLPKISTNKIEGVSISLESYKDTTAAVHGNGYSGFALGDKLHIYQVLTGNVTTLPLPRSLQPNPKLAMDNRCMFLLDQPRLSSYCADYNVTSSSFEWKLNQAIQHTSVFPERKSWMLDIGTTFIQDGPRTIARYQWNGDTNSWATETLTSNSDIQHVRLSEKLRIFAWLDNSNTIYWTRGSKDSKSETWNWTSLQSHRTSTVDCGHFFSSNLDLGSKLEKMLKEWHRDSKFELQENVLALGTCSLSDWTFNHNIDLVILDNFGRGHHKSIVLPKDNLRTITEVQKNKDKESGKEYTIRFSYVNENGRFLINLKVDGEKEDTNKEVLKKFREDQAKLDNRFQLIDFSKYRMNLGPGAVIYLNANETISHNKDQGWVTKRNKDGDDSDLKLPLGDGLSLTKSKTDETLQIENKSSEVVQNLEIKNSTNLLYLHPYYFGVTQGSAAKVIRFLGNGRLATSEYPGEEFIRAWSGPFAAVTREINRVSKIHIRTQLSEPQQVVTKLQVISRPFVDKTTHFEYGQPHGTLTGKLAFQELRVIPGKLPKLYGWAQHEFLTTLNGTEKVSKSFDGLGNFIETLEQEKAEEEDPEDKRFILMDKSGKFKVTDWSPFELDSCQVGYIGFEDTESYQASGNCTSWNFPKDNIVKGEFSLTGKNFLRLSGSEKIQMDIPWVKGQSYSILTWVRPQNGGNNTIEKLSPILTASLFTPNPVNWISTLMYRVGRWSLLSIQVKDEQILGSQTFESKNGTSFPLNPEDIHGSNFTLRFVISGNQNDSFIDVDNVLFAPPTWDAPLGVLDPDTMQGTETIMGRTGLISRTRFDAFGRHLVNINPRGEVTHLDLRSNEANPQGLVSSWRFRASTNPGWFELCDPDIDQALYLENPGSWKVAPGMLESLPGNGNERIFFRVGPQSSLVFRFSYALIGASSSFKVNFFGIKIQTRNKNGGTYLCFGEAAEEIEIGTDNSLMFALLDEQRLGIWGDQDLVFEKYLNGTEPDPEVWFEVTGKIILTDMVFIPDPSIEVRYSTLIPNQEIQRISLVSATSVQVSQMLHDELTRPYGETKKTLITITNGPLLGFRPNFVVEKRDTTSSLKLFGEVHSNHMEDGGYAFTRVKFQDNAVKEDWESEGQPGTNYHLGGKFETKYSFQPNSKVKVLFPPDQSFTYRVVRTVHGFEETSVYQKIGKKKLMCAKVALLPLGTELLATYEYDFHGNLIRTLSPEFHRIHRTFLQSVPYSSIRFNMTSPASSGFQSRYKFDSRGRLVEMQTPDGGVSNFIFDNWNNLAATAHRPRIGTQTDMLLYFEYNKEGEGTLSEIGLFKNFNATAPVSRILENPEGLQKIPRKLIRTLDSQDKSVYQKSDLITSVYEDDRDYIESVGYDVTLAKPTLRYEIIPTDPGYPALLARTQYEYNVEGDSILKVVLPFQSWAIKNEYDRLGNHVRVALLDAESGKQLNVATYHYNGGNQIVKETLSDLTRNATLVTEFGYNSPGYPVSNKNSLVQETYSYEDEGYGGFSLGRANAIMSSESKRLWKNPNKRLSIQSLVRSTGVTSTFAEQCLAALSREGYFHNGRIQKMFYPELVDSVPYECKVGKDAQNFHRFWSQEFVSQHNSFGFKYQFGGHGDLIKVKFVDDTSPDVCSEPLTTKSLGRKLPVFETSKIRSLWSELVRHQFLVQDKIVGMSTLPHGRRGKSLTNPDVLAQLRDLDLDEDHYVQDLLSFLARNVANSTITARKLSSKLETWQSSGHQSPSRHKDSEKILDYLTRTEILKANRMTDGIFDTTFKAIVEGVFGNTSDIFTIFGTLIDFFGCSLGTSPFDLEVLDQDANGNFKIFYNGAQLVRSEYEPGTNKLAGIQISEFGETKRFTVTHDSFGNLNSAPHKGIQAIKYDPVFARPVMFTLNNGQIVRIRYDYKGERVSKELWSALEADTKSRRILFRKKYVTRDDQNRCLLEEESWFTSPDVPPRTRTTIFMYGPRGLVAFFRNGKVYNVYTDNINSVRFVLLNGEVVASYDYLPYGEVMAQFVDHSDAELSYRFTGQEWDQELGGLYNFHARIYDPSLGRFYQMDPKQQFFSPYKYGGNSPLNVVDPDGKFIGLAFLFGVLATALVKLIIFAVASAVLAVVGAYLSAAAVNQSWNPKDWKWKKPGTWLGLIFGGIGGALLPFGGAASFAFLTGTVGLSAAAAGTVIGVTAFTTAYLSISASQQTLAFWRWKDLDKPMFWSALFGGASFGVSLYGGVGQWGKAFTDLSTKLGKGLFLAGSIGTGGGFAYLNNVAAFNSWNPKDWNGFAVYHGLTGGFAGFIGAAGVYQAGKYFTHQGFKLAGRVGFADHSQNIISTAKHSSPTYFAYLSRSQWIALAKIGGAAGALALSTYLGLASASNDWTNINLKDAATVAGLFDGMWNGFVFTLDASNVKKVAKIKVRKIQKVRLEKKLGKLQRIKGQFSKFAAKFKEIVQGKLDETPHGGGDKPVAGATFGIMASDSKLIIAIAGASTTDADGNFIRKVGVLAVADDYLNLDPASPSALRVIDLPDNIFDPSVPLEQRAITGLGPQVDNEIRKIIGDNRNAAQRQYVQDFNQAVDSLDLNKVKKTIPYLSDIPDETLHQNIKSNVKDRLMSDLQTGDGASARVQLGAAIRDQVVEKFKNTLREKWNDFKSFDPQKQASIFQAIEGQRLGSDEYKLIPKSYKKQFEQGLQTLGGADGIKTNFMSSEKTVNAFVKKMKGLKETYENIAVPWDASNCAEPHCLVGAKWIRDQTSELTPNPLQDWKLESKEIKYSTAYDLETLKDKVRCANCLVTTESLPSGPIKYILTEDGWQKDLNRLIANKDAQIQKYESKSRDYYSYPMFVKYLVRPQNSTIPVRAKRSTQEIQLQMSSGAGASSGILPELIKRIKGLFKSTPSVPQMFPDDLLGKPILELSLPLHGNGNEDRTGSSKSKSKLGLRSCVPYAWHDGEYYLDAFTCSNTLGTVKVFPMHHVAGEQNNQLAPSLLGDNYGNCQFLFSSKTAYCEGTNSKFLYQPTQIDLPFDRVNDQLLLLLTALNLWQKWTSDEVESSTSGEDKTETPKTLMGALRDQVRALEGRIEACSDEQFRGWGKHLMEDRREDLECFEAQGWTLEERQLFEENLADLELELGEIEMLSQECCQQFQNEFKREPSLWENYGSYFVQQLFRQ